MAAHDLALYEEILLLALHDEKGTVSSGSMYGLGLGGAIFAELMLAGRIGVVQEGRKSFVVRRDPKPAGDAILEEAVAKVRDAKRRASPQTWVSRFGSIKDLRHRVARSLVNRGVLRAAEGRFLLVFTRRTYPTVDAASERALIERLRSAIFGSAREVDARTAVLVPIAHATGLLAPVFGKKELKARKARLGELSRGAVAGHATKAAVEAVQAAVVAATVAATAAAASSG